MSLGKFIANRRKYMRLTQEELADKINVSKSAIAKWETDAGIPDRDNLQRLAKAIGVSVDDLHRIIDTNNLEDVDFEVNITPEVIAALESYGYKVIRTGSGTDTEESEN
ncbi:MAG: helix-turn-helix transcriptional regulator [Lachnospiraceae bacterium]|nr:helix-turn-helix transcriptional regulator [Lachnospiraceae bacterium]